MRCQCTTKPPVKYDRNALHVAAVLRRNPALCKVLGMLPTHAVDWFKDKGYIMPVSDLEITFVLNDPNDRQDKPCLVIECKSPHEFTIDTVTHTFMHWQECMGNIITAPNSVEIPMRALLMLHAGSLSTDAKYVFACIVELYHTLVVRKQSYGLLTSGVASIVLYIDWKHPTEPGQHVKYRLFTGDPWKAMPPWQDDFEPSLQYIMLCLSLLHLEKGLIQDDQMDQLVDNYLNQIDDGYIPSEDDGDDLHDGDYHDASDHDDGDTNDDSSDCTQGSQHGWPEECFQPEARPPRQEQPNRHTTHFDVLRRLLDVAPDTSKQALENFFQPVDPKLCRLAKPAELVQFSAQLVQRQVRKQGVWQDELDMLHPRPLVWGPVPVKLNRMLALADEKCMGLTDKEQTSRSKDSDTTALADAALRTITTTPGADGGDRTSRLLVGPTT